MMRFESACKNQLTWMSVNILSWLFSWWSCYGMILNQGNTETTEPILSFIRDVDPVIVLYSRERFSCLVELFANIPFCAKPGIKNAWYDTFHVIVVMICFFSVFMTAPWCSPYLLKRVGKSLSLRVGTSTLYDHWYSSSIVGIHGEKSHQPHGLLL